MLKEHYECIRLIISKKRDTLLGIISIGIGLFSVPSRPIIITLILFLLLLLWSLYVDGRSIYNIFKEKHLPFLVLAGRKDEEYESMMSEVLQTMKKYKFDKQSFEDDFNVDQDNYILRRHENLSENPIEWDKMVHTFENKIIKLSAKLKGRKIFHIFLNCPAPLAMGMGAVLGTKYEVVLHHHQTGCGEDTYFPVIDFYSMSKTNQEGVHILKSRVSSPDYFIKVEEPEILPPSTMISTHLAGHDPKGDVEKIAVERSLKAVHIRSTTQGTIPIDADWLRASREIATYLLNLSAKKEIKTIELYLSIPIVIAFTIGMALGIQSPVILNNWFSETKKYYPVIELNKLRQPR